jgi:hypothetical protein
MPTRAIRAARRPFFFLAAVLGLACAGVSPLAGCKGFASSLIGPQTKTPEFRRVVDSFERTESIDRLVEQAFVDAYNDPTLIKDLRGVVVGAALASLGRGERREAPKIGGYFLNKRFEAGTLDSLIYAFYYWAKAAENEAFKTNPRLSETVRLALRTRDRRPIHDALDLLTETASGEPLEGKEYEEFKAKRGRINSWLDDLDLHPDLKVGHKKFENNLMASPRDNQLRGAAYAETNQIAAGALTKLVSLADYLGVYGPEERPRLLADLRIERSDAVAMRDNAAASVAPANIRLWGVHSVEPPGYHAILLFQNSAGDSFVLTILTDSPDRGQTLAKLAAKKIIQAAVSGEVSVPRALPE